MLKPRLILFIPVIVSLISGCIYSDFGSHLVEPIADEPPVISATTNLDTMYNPVVSDSLKVIYDIDIRNGELYYLDASVSNFQVYDSDTTQGSFWLYPNDAQVPGIDTLKLKIYYSSNTNSLADVLGIEALNISLKYAIDFHRTIR
ncbi:MAG: hypothetical protein ABFS28_10030 [Bacteroidota bacterium]